MASARTMYKMKVERIVDHTPQIRELFLSHQDPNEFVFKAGQFVTLHVPQPEKPAMRAYSIASDERNTKSLQLIFKYVEQGVASTYVWSLRGGEILNCTGPFGRVLFKEPPTSQIVFFNTGSGVSQHLSYLLSKKEQYPNLRYKMYFGVRHEQDIYYKSELENLKQSLENFEYHFVLSRPGEAWQGKRGYVQNFLSEIDFMNTPTTFYLCGNGAMIKDTKAALEAKGFDKTRVFAEAFD